MESAMMMTPIRPLRRKRISLSPKKPKFKPRISDPYPQPQTPTTLSPPQFAPSEVEFDFPFSYFDEDKKLFTMLSQTQSAQLLQVLRLHFSEVLAIMPVAPFLIIECDKAVPDPATTPFMIAGLIACFMIQGSPYPFGIEFIGRDGGADGLTEDQVPTSVWRDIQPFHIPNLETFRWIHQNIRSATHVSSFPQQLVIELEKMTNQHFEEILETLPDTIGCMNVGYVNGQLLSKERGHQKAPQPRGLDGDYDDTDYLAPENGGILKPGILFECGGILNDNDARQGIVLTNSGIKVKKRDIVRVTVANHGWDAVDDKVVYHPSKAGGRSVGNIVEQIGEDIGLLDCTVPFVNEFPELGIQAKSFIRSSQIKYNEYVVIDSCFTGVQKLRALGVRTGAERHHPTATTDEQSTPGPLPEHYYIKIVQGIYGVKSAVIPGEPAIREGVCGTPIILAGKNRKEMTARLGNGVVAGFMSWNNIMGMYNTDGQVYSFCQPVDPLIEDGWMVYRDA